MRNESPVLLTKNTRQVSAPGRVNVDGKIKTFIQRALTLCHNIAERINRAKFGGAKYSDQREDGPAFVLEPIKHNLKFRTAHAHIPVDINVPEVRGSQAEQFHRLRPRIMRGVGRQYDRRL